MRKITRSALFLFAAALSACGTAATTATIAPTPDPRPAVTAPDHPPLASPFVDLDTVRAGRFDGGKMWTFDNPPLEYFQEAYGFVPDEEWFRHARLGALRFSEYCSASWVSPNGLILTNHHCARESIADVTLEEEMLLDEGFYAASAEDERRVDDLMVEQLISIEDVTQEVSRALAGITSPEERMFARDDIISDIEERMTAEAGGEEAGMRVQIISLYHGGAYSAYTFRQYRDIRLVAAPELQLGHFGGDPDNFTYPRYSLDFAFFRAYDTTGAPQHTPDYFNWSFEGAQDGDLVFVVGNPGSTSRLFTLAQLDYVRDYEVPRTIRMFEERVEILRAFDDENPRLSERLGVRNTVFSLDNALKSFRGKIEGLYDPVLMARKRDAERSLREAIEQDEALRGEYGDLFDQIADVEARRTQTADRASAYSINPSTGSVLLVRAIYGVFQALHMAAGSPQEIIDGLQEEMAGLENRSDDLERDLLAAQFRDMVRYLGHDDPVVRAVLEGMTPEERAAQVIRQSALTDSAAYMEMAGPDFVRQQDPAIDIARALLEPLAMTQYEIGLLDAEQEELTSRLAQARFEVYGTAFPPDATFSLRLADGVVRGYPYNGTIAPPVTTYYGLFERHSAFGREHPWDLPDRWIGAGENIDLSVPLNLVSTNDIVGGNSGSPLLNRNLELVGVVFDGNIESLSGDFIYTDERARCISVDARGIIESLRAVYGADRILGELETGVMSGVAAGASAAAE